jgi:protein gp37
VFVNSMSDLFHARVPLDFVRRVIEVIEQTPQHTYQILTKRASRLPKVADKLTWPPNLWMGISVEDADHLDRVDDLRCVPAAARFLSCEPLVGPLDGIDLTGIDWVIVGGESGAKASPMHPDWARSLRDKCQQAKIPYFFKQWGSWAPTGKVGLGQPLPGEIFAGDPDDQGWRVEMRRVAKKSAFRELDGRTWDEFPQPHHRREVA